MADAIFKTIIPLKVEDIEKTVSDSEKDWKKLEKNQDPLTILRKKYGRNTEEVLAWLYTSPSITIREISENIIIII